MTAALTALRHVHIDELEVVRPLLLEIYAEVYAEQIRVDPFFSVDRFAERLASHTSHRGWEAVIGYAEGMPVGYAYGSPLTATTSWWKGVQPPPSTALAREDGARTFALWELMVRSPWRGTGIATAVHEELVTGRPEERVVLSVERSHPRVRAMYERWGYSWVGAVQDAPDAPVFDLMARSTRPAGA